MPNDKCNTIERISDWLYLTFPFLFGREIKDHVLVNPPAGGGRASPCLLVACCNRLRLTAEPPVAEGGVDNGLIVIFALGAVIGLLARPNIPLNDAIGGGISRTARRGIDAELL